MRRDLLALGVSAGLALCACSAESGPCPDEIGGQVQSLAREHGQCASVDDCVEITSGISCYAGCRVAVAVTERDDFTAELGELDRSICAGTNCRIYPECATAGLRCGNGLCSNSGTGP
jgi:hypothetical protein